MSRDYRNTTGKNSRNNNASRPGRQERNVTRPDFSRKYKEIEDPYGMDRIERRKGPGATRPANSYVTREQYARQRSAEGAQSTRPKKQRKTVSTRPQEETPRERISLSADIGHRASHIQRPSRPGSSAGRGSYTVVDDDRESRYVDDVQARDPQAVAKATKWSKKRIIALSAIAAVILIAISAICISRVINNVSNDTKKLYFWADCTNDPAMEQYLQRVVDEYNRQQDKVQVELKTRFNDYTATITYRYREKTKPSTGSAPDINLVYGNTMQDMVQIGNIYDLSQDMKEAGYNYSAMFGGLMVPNVNMVGEAVYALPYMVNPYATAYNVDLFEEIGVDTQDIPCTVEGLLAMNAKFNALSNDERGSVFGFALPTNDPSQWLATILQIGKAHGVNTFDYSTLTRKYSLLTDLVTQLTDSSKMSMSGVGTYEEMVEKFAKGQIAVIIADYDTLRDKLDQENSSFNIKTTRILEYLPFVQPHSADLYDVTYLEINKSSVNKAEAYEFMMYLMRNDNMSQLYKDTGNIPASWNSMEYQPPVDEILAAYFDFENRIRLPEPMGSATEGITVGEIYNQLRDGLLTPANALTTLEQQENESIKQALKSERIKAEDYTIYYKLYKD